MTRLLNRSSRPSVVRPVVLAGVAAVTALGLAVPGTALAFGHGHHDATGQPVPPPPAHPTSADQIQNIGQVASAIKAYYGDTVTDQVDPVSNDLDHEDVTLHTYSQDSAYVDETAGIERRAVRYLAHAGHHEHGDRGKRAILLDVDDTVLNTYPYEIYANFGYDPVENGAFVTAPDYDLPAVPGMPRLVNWADAHGYTVFYVTGRPESQRDGTVQDLQARNLPLSDSGNDPDNVSNLYLNNVQKDADGNITSAKPWITCDTDGDKQCSTIERKSQTRRHIEQDLGYDIVANFGDQFSDLKGGFADRTFKLPNPMYYLP